MTFEQWLNEPVKDSKYGYTRRDCYTETEIKVMAVAWYAALDAIGQEATGLEVAPCKWCGVPVTEQTERPADYCSHGNN